MMTFLHTVRMLAHAPHCAWRFLFVKLLGSKLLQGKVGCHQAVGGCLPSLWSWVHHASARAWLKTISLNCVAILGSVAHEWDILGKAFDAGSNGAHPFCGACTSTTTVVPGVAVAWWACWGVIIHRSSNRSSTKRILWLVEARICQAQGEEQCKHLGSNHSIKCLCVEL